MSDPVDYGAVVVYKEFFQLSRNPFELTPDPSFICRSAKIEEALASISYAISQRKGFAVMTGEVGTGKTFVLHCLFELWTRQEVAFANIFAPRLSVIDFLTYAASDLGIQNNNDSKANLLRAFYGFVLAQREKGGTTVLVIDEAHQAPSDVLEEIRMLTNVETNNEKLVQILLVGQPELDVKLDSFDLRQLKQRIAVRCQLEPLSQEESCHYIEQRLRFAGANANASKIFPSETAKAIYRYSRGIPRVINSICDQALTTACARHVRVVPVEIVESVASRFRLVPAGESDPTRRVSKALDPGPLSSQLNLPTPVAALAVESPSAEASVHRSAPKLAPDPAVHSPTGVSAIWKTWRGRWPVPSKLLASTTALVLVAGLSVGGIAVSRRSPAGHRYSVAVGTASPSAASVAADASDAGAVRVPAPAELSTPTIKSNKSSANSTAGVVPREIQTAKLTRRPDEAVPGLTVAAPKLYQPIPKSLGFLESEPPPILGVQENSSLRINSDLFGDAPSTPVSPPGGPLGGNLEEPKLISSTAAAYPTLARTENIQGVVVIDALVDATGKVANMKVISGPPLLAGAAMDALRTWKYQPAKLNDHPIEVHTIVRINFDLH